MMWCDAGGIGISICMCSLHDDVSWFASNHGNYMMHVFGMQDIGTL